MIQIESTLHRNLDGLAKEHYDTLRLSIERKINKNRLGQWLKDFLKINLKTIITGKPKELIRLNKSLKKLAGKHLKSPLQVNARLKLVFDYNWLAKDKKRAYAFATKLGINTCPYCNRNYTVTVIDSNKKGVIRPDFDHFFPKSQYPLLALSFYNLIPSCPLCNRSVKGASETVYGKHIHPYESCYSANLRFNFTPLDVDSLMGLSTNIEITTLSNTNDMKSSKQCENSFKLFRLKEIYQNSHLQEVADIIRKHHVSGGRYLELLQKQFKDLGSLDELYRIAFGAYLNENEFINRPLSKMTKDIVDQLKFTMPLVKQFKP